MAILTPSLQSVSVGGRCKWWWPGGFVLAILLALGGLAGRTSAQTVSREYQLKAVILYNLTQFTEWPASAFTTNNAPMVIGILGDDPFGGILDETVFGEKSNDHPIEVKRLSSVDEAKGCHIVFIGSNRKKDMPAILAELKDLPVLTVADTEGFNRSGGMIRIYENAERKIRLRINLAAVKSGKLVMSAKLLRVAEVINSDED